MNNQRKRMILWTMMIVLAVTAGMTGVVMMTTSIRADDTVQTCTPSSGVTGDGTSSWRIEEDCVMHIGPGRLGHAVRNDDGAFKPLWGIPGADKVKSITIDDPTNTSFPSDAAGIFSNIEVDSIDGMERINTAGTTDMSYMFYNSNLKNQNPDAGAILTYWNTDVVETVSHMYDGYRGQIILRATHDLPVLTDASYMYANYKGNHIEVNFYYFDMHNVKNASHMFYNSKFDLLEGFSEKQYPYYSTLEDTSYMFSKTDNGDRYAGVPALGMTGVKNSSHMFDGAKMYMDMNNSYFDMSNVEDASYMYSNIYYPDGYVNISNWNCPKLTNMKGLFAGSKLEGAYLMDMELPAVEDMSIGYPSDPTANDELTTIGEWGIIMDGTNIGGSRTALNDMLNGVRMHDFDEFGGFTSTTPKDTIGVKNTVSDSGKLALPGLDMQNIDGITLKGNRGGQSGGQSDFLDLVVLGDYGKLVSLNVDDVWTKTMDLGQLTTSNDGSINLTYGLETLIVHDETHVTSAPAPVSESPDVARWIRKTPARSSGYDWASKIRTAGDDLVKETAGDHAGGTYVGQKAHGVEFDKNMTDELTAGAVPDPIEDEYPSDIPVTDGGMKADDRKFKSWNTKSDGSGVDYHDGDVFKENGLNTLYAVWESTLSNELDFDPNNGVGQIPAKVTNKRTAKIDCTKTPSHDGATFIGWSKSKSDIMSGATAGEDGQVIACGTSDNDTVEMPVGSTKLYAVWGKNPKLIFDVNRPNDMNGELPSSKPINGTWWINGKTSKTVIGRDFKGWTKGMSPDGKYQFNGWVNEDGTPFEGTELEHDDVTIRADWTKIEPETPAATTPDYDVEQADPTVDQSDDETKESPSVEDDVQDQDTQSEPTIKDGAAMNDDKVSNEEDPAVQDDSSDHDTSMARTGIAGMPLLLIVTVMLATAGGALAVIRRHSVK